MVLEELQNSRYLIIGGTTKAATTSLFFYLKEHPQVCAANLKETRFFLDDEYPLSSKYRLADGVEKYANFYLHCASDALRVEATPDYLYSTGAPEKIKVYLPCAKLLFILREPISRLISWYRFAQQNGDLAPDVSFDAYVERMSKEAGQACRPQHMLALEQGRYACFLKSYLETLGQERVYVAFYEELQKAPAAVLENICTFAEIDPCFYQNFDFKVHNKTETMRYPLVHKAYIKIRFQIRKLVHDKPMIRGGLRKLRQYFDTFYLRLNTKSGVETVMSRTTDQFLKDYYAKEIVSLQALLGRAVPW